MFNHATVRSLRVQRFDRVLVSLGESVENLRSRSLIEQDPVKARADIRSASQKEVIINKLKIPNCSLPWPDSK